MTSFIVFSVLVTFASASLITALTGKPRLIWGRTGSIHFTRVEQTVVCSFWSVVLFFTSALYSASLLTPNRSIGFLLRLKNLVNPMTLLFMFLSILPLAWGISRFSSESSVTEKVRDVALTVLGAIILLANIFQLAVAAKAAL
jgi:hypothetical protein